MEGSKWGTVMYSDYDQGIMIHRIDSSDSLRISILGNNFDIDNFFKNEWRSLVIQLYEKSNLTIYVDG